MKFFIGCFSLVNKIEILEFVLIKFEEKDV